MKSLRIPWMISMLLVMLGIWCGDGNGDCNAPWRWWLWSVMVIMNAVTPMVLVMLAAAKWTGFTLAYLGLKPGLEAHQQPGLPTLPPMHCSTSPSTHCSAIRWALRCTFLISTPTPTHLPIWDFATWRCLATKSLKDKCSLWWGIVHHSDLLPQ